ncbi:MAG TPA: PQQ-binding-like beta-propeller repeat protein [Pirellulales bacterium]|jgi:outer membrane protein assembly factor BamB|nr:PQQ-binding-like beta-propeller repeat protein [Pirellulales bacterium]
MNPRERWCSRLPLRAAVLLTLLAWLTAAIAIAARGWAQAADAEEPRSRSARASNAQSSPATSEFSAPDYTNLSGFVAVADLPTEMPAVLWKYTSQHSLTDVVVADGDVYGADGDGNVFALYADDGAKIWKQKHASRISQEPSVDKDHVYFGSDVGITAIGREYGNPVWHFAVALGAGEASPLPVGNRVYASAYDGMAYALDRSTGAVLWKHDFGADAPPDPPDGGFAAKRARFGETIARPNGSACDGKLFIQSVFDQSRVIALDCETGARRWTFQAAGWISPAPTIVDGRVFIGSQDGNLYCLDLATGKLLWKFKAPNWLASRVAVHDGKVFLPNHCGMLIQLSAESGEKLQTFQTTDEADRQSLTYGFPIIAGQNAYFAVGSGQLYAVDVATSKLSWTLRPSEGSELFTDPATDGRRIFVNCRTSIDKKGENAIIAVGRKK